MLEEQKMVRINELAKKSKVEPLSDEEKKEQKELREAYLANFRENFKQQLENIEIVDEEVYKEED